MTDEEPLNRIGLKISLVTLELTNNPTVDENSTILTSSYCVSIVTIMRSDSMSEVQGRSVSTKEEEGIIAHLENSLVRRTLFHFVAAVSMAAASMVSAVQAAVVSFGSFSKQYGERLFRKALIASVLCIVLVGTAHAAPVTYIFSGTLNDPFGSLSVGTPFIGSFSYDDSQPLNTPSSPWRGDYGYTSLSVTFGSTTVVDSGTGVINVYDHGPDGTYPPMGMGETTGYPTDLFHLYTFSVSGTLGGLTLAPGAGLQLVLQDLSGSVFDFPSIPGANLTINDFTLGNATFLELREAYSLDPFYWEASARGELTYLSSSSGGGGGEVPEPSTLAIFGLGALGMASRSRRRN